MYFPQSAVKHVCDQDTMRERQDQIYWIFATQKQNRMVFDVSEPAGAAIERPEQRTGTRRAHNPT